MESRSQFLLDSKRPSDDEGEANSNTAVRWNSEFCKYCKLHFFEIWERFVVRSPLFHSIGNSIKLYRAVSFLLNSYTKVSRLWSTLREKTTERWSILEQILSSRIAMSLNKFDPLTYCLGNDSAEQISQVSFWNLDCWLWSEHWCNLHALPIVERSLFYGQLRNLKEEIDPQN